MFPETSLSKSVHVSVDSKLLGIHDIQAHVNEFHACDACLLYET